MDIKRDKTQEIIEDFAREIRQKKMEASPAESTQIDFRNGVAENREEKVSKVPLELLRFRKENGRISSSVKTHERVVGPLDPSDSGDQRMLGQFLREKDPEKAEELKQLLRADGQREPGIVTADGFIINGNRRKVALLDLQAEFPANDIFKTMKVVILPGRDDEGGPPTLKEIEQIENRYQLQAEGKADYYGFDAALSIRDKETRGYSLEQQMRDDPQYKLMENAEFSRAVRKRRKETLAPLECVDEYLDAIGRPGEYACVSRGVGDPEGRWQAFIDLQGFYARARTEKGRQEMRIDPKQAGEVLQAAYSIVRMRTIPNFGKLHIIMRDLAKYTKHGSAHLVELSKNVRHTLPPDEMVDAHGDRLSSKVIDEAWRSKYRSEITRRLVKAKDAKETENERNAPMALLEDSLAKLCHENMIVDKIDVNALREALKLTNGIAKRVDDLRKAVYSRVKTSEKLGAI